MPPMNPIDTLASIEVQTWADYAALLLRNFNGKSNAGDGAALPLLAKALYISSPTVIAHAGALKEAIGLTPLAKELPARRKALEDAEAAAKRCHADLCAKLDGIRAEASRMAAEERRHLVAVGEVRYGAGDAPSDILLRTTGPILNAGELEHKTLLAAIEPLREPVAEAVAALARIDTLRAQHPQLFAHIELPG